MIGTILICILTYAAIRAAIETYHAIRLAGFERGLAAAEPMIEYATRAAYRQGRIDQLNVDRQAIYDVSEESFTAGRSSVMFSCLDRVN